MFRILKEIYNFRNLLLALVNRHLASRYRGSVLGFLWSFLNPLCLMLVYTLVFKYYIRFEQVENYSIFLFCGLLPWIWLQSSLIEGTSSISSSGHLITKSMFPAHILPAVNILTALIHFILSLPLLIIFMLFADMPIHLTWAYLPIILTVETIFLYGLALTLASLNVFYRDVQHLLGNVLSFIFFLCPILYTRDTVPEKFRFTLDLNPLAQFTEVYHAILLDGRMPAFNSIVCLLVWAILFFLIGSLVYQRNHENFAELL
jgi:lipopolysaccharide transport system permease protein